MSCCGTDGYNWRGSVVRRRASAGATHSRGDGRGVGSVDVELDASDGARGRGVAVMVRGKAILKSLKTLESAQRDRGMLWMRSSASRYEMAS